MLYADDVTVVDDLSSVRRFQSAVTPATAVHAEHDADVRQHVDGRHEPHGHGPGDARRVQLW